MLDGSLVVAWVSWSVCCANAGALVGHWPLLTWRERITALGISAMAAWIALWAWA